MTTPESKAAKHSSGGVMTKRLSIPRTDGEAERFLWHSLQWIREMVPLSNREGKWLKEAEDIVLSRINQLAGVDA